MRRSIQTLILSVAALGLTATAASALTVHVNESRRVALRGVAANVVIGDTNVADVAMVDSRSVIIMGKGYGSTQLTVTDARGRNLLADDVTVIAPDNGRVTVYRGVGASEYVCDGGRCHPTSDGKNGGVAAGGSGGGAGGSSSYGSPGAVTMNMSMKGMPSSFGGEAAAAAANAH